MPAFILVCFTLLCSSYHHILYIKALAPHFDIFHAIVLLYGQSFFGLLIVSILSSQTYIPTVSIARDPLFIARGLFAIAGHLCLMYALCVFGLSQVALSSYVSFTITAIGSVWRIEKNLSYKKITPLFIALLGLICANSQSTAFEHGFIWPVLSAVFFSFSSLVAKKLTQSYCTEAIVWGLLASMTVGLFFILLIWDSSALFFYGETDLIHQGIALGSIYAVLHLILIKSYHNYPLSYITLLKTLKVPLALFLDWTYYHRSFSVAQILGAVFICSAMVLREYVIENYIQTILKRIRRFAIQLKVLS